MGMHKSGRNDTKTPGGSVDMNTYQDKTLADYIARKQEDISFPKQPLPEKKKLTFEEWFCSRWWGSCVPVSRLYAEEIWKAAQENV